MLCDGRDACLVGLCCTRVRSDLSAGFVSKASETQRQKPNSSSLTRCLGCSLVRTHPAPEERCCDTALPVRPRVASDSPLQAKFPSTRAPIYNPSNNYYGNSSTKKTKKRNNFDKSLDTLNLEL
eukprot:5749931-Amphidinium_carterae.1